MSLEKKYYPSEYVNLMGNPVDANPQKLKLIAQTITQSACSRKFDEATLAVAYLILQAGVQNGNQVQL